MIRIELQNDWVIIIITCCIFLYIFMLQSLRRESTVAEFLLQKFPDSTNNFLSWVIIGTVFCALFSVLISQYIPIVPKLIRSYNVLGYELNKFGFTFLAVGGFYITRSLMTYLFFAATGSGRRWDIFYFTSSKFYFIFSLVILGMCIVEFYFPVHRGQLFSTYISIIGLVFISKIIYYLAHPAGMLPRQWYYKFLYICTLQIVPVLVLWRLFFI